MQTSTSARVCIVGAGPVGLSLALRLADFGIAAVIFDENPGLKREGSKACLIQGDVLEILDRSNCAAAVHAAGVPWRTSNVYIGGKSINQVEYQLENRYGPFVNISQYQIEQILLAEILRRPQLSIRWLTRVIGIEQTKDAVRVEYENDSRRGTQEFAYAIACNGQRSNIRELVGASWLGYRHTAQFLITDIKARLPFPKERHFHFDPPFNRGYQVIIHPQPDDVWRIDWQLPPDVDVEADRRDGQLDRRIRSVIGAIDYSLEWLSVYRFQQRMVDRFVNGRVIFAGDAAHALPPYGSRGMNSGIQDADNLAWKLALVLEGSAAPELLDTYHSERAAAARENIDVTEKTIRFMVPKNPLVKLRRKLLFMLARRYRGFRKYVNSGTMARPHRYLASPIVQPAETAQVVGMFVTDITIEVAGRLLNLRELLGRGFTFLYVGASGPSVLPRPQALALGTLASSVVVLSTETASPGTYPAEVLWARADAVALRNFEPDKWHLIRPDMHVAGVFRFQSSDQFEVALRNFSLSSINRRTAESLAAPAYRSHQGAPAHVQQ